MSRQSGFSLVEFLVAMTISVFLLLGVMNIYSQVSTIEGAVESNSVVHGNLRSAMDRVERDLRMVGFAVPLGTEIGGSDDWTPPIFYATSSQIGFRADLDGGDAEIICTPTSINTACPLRKLRLDDLGYYQALGCSSPFDGSPLQLVAVLNGRDWAPVTCSGIDTSDDSIRLSADVADDTFTGGISRTASVEQVYLRYQAQSQPPYGSLFRYVRYSNTPDDRWPPRRAQWSRIATNLTDFWLEYQDEAGNALTTFPLGEGQRVAVRKIVLFMEGYDGGGPGNIPQIVRTRSHIVLRNPQM